MVDTYREEHELLEAEAQLQAEEELRNEAILEREKDYQPHETEPN